jgi:hypothetical protein
MFDLFEKNAPPFFLGQRVIPFVAKSDSLYKSHENDGQWH